MTKSQKRQKIMAERTPSRRASKALRQDKLPFTKEKETGMKNGPGVEIPKNIELKNDSGTVPTDATGKKPSYAEAASIPMQERLPTSLKEPKPPPQLKKTTAPGAVFPSAKKKTQKAAVVSTGKAAKISSSGKKPVAAASTLVSPEQTAQRNSEDEEAVLPEKPYTGWSLDNQDSGWALHSQDTGFLSDTDSILKAAESTDDTFGTQIKPGLSNLFAHPAKRNADDFKPDSPSAKSSSNSSKSSNSRSSKSRSSNSSSSNSSSDKSRSSKSSSSSSSSNSSIKSRSSNRSKSRSSASTSKAAGPSCHEKEEEPASSTPDYASDVTPPQMKKGGRSTENPNLANAKGTRNLPKRNILKRYDAKIFVRQTETGERPDGVLREAVIEYMEKLKEADSSLYIAPWRLGEKDAPAPIMQSADIPSKMGALKKFFPRANPIRAGGHVYTTALIGHTTPLLDIKEEIEWWWKEWTHGMWLRPLQCEDTTVLGWLLYSLLSMLPSPKRSPKFSGPRWDYALG
jgi:hypothetical protein